MRNPFAALAPIALTAATLAASPTWAGVNPTHYQDATDFHAQGVIDQVTNFDAYVVGDITFLGDPYSDGLLTITSTQNSVFGQGYPGYAPVRNALVNNYLEPLTVAIDAPGYNLFSFQIGDLVGSAGVTLWIDTNLDSFGFGISTFPSNEGFKFHGFLAPDGQYFTGFHFSANDDVTAPAFAEFELGHVPSSTCSTRVCGGGSVPEPMSWALMVLGFGGIGAMLRRRGGRLTGTA